MDTFVCATRLCFGQNALQALGTLAAKRVLLVTDPFFVQNGTTQRVLSHLSGAETEIFDRVKGEPSLALVAEGVEVFRKAQPDTVLALGGGSARRREASAHRRSIASRAGNSGRFPVGKAAKGHHCRRRNGRADALLRSVCLEKRDAVHLRLGGRCLPHGARTSARLLCRRHRRAR